MTDIETYTAPAVVKVSALPSVQEIQNITSLCQTLSTCHFYQKLGPGGVLAIWLTAREMGLPPMMCLNGGMYTFSGAVTLSAQMINMLLVNAGHRAEVVELDDTKCKLKFFRGDRPEGQGNTFEYSFTLEMAQKAGYMNKDNWKKHTRDMLFNRALSGGARKFMPDVMLNAYVHGELEESEPVKSKPPIQVISREQAEVIENLLSQCPEDKKKNFYDHIRKLNANSVSDIPVFLFETLRKKLQSTVDLSKKSTIEVEAEIYENNDQGENENE